MSEVKIPLDHGDYFSFGNTAKTSFSIVAPSLSCPEYLLTMSEVPKHNKSNRKALIGSSSLLLLLCLGTILNLVLIYFVLSWAEGKSVKFLLFGKLQFESTLSFLVVVFRGLMSYLLLRISIAVFWGEARRGTSLATAADLFEFSPISYSRAVVSVSPPAKAAVLGLLLLFACVSFAGPFMQASLVKDSGYVSGSVIQQFYNVPDQNSERLRDLVSQTSYQILSVSGWGYRAATLFPASSSESFNFVKVLGVDGPVDTSIRSFGSVKMNLLIKSTCTPTPISNTLKCDMPACFYVGNLLGRYYFAIVRQTLQFTILRSGTPVESMSCTFDVGSGYVSNALTDTKVQANISSFEAIPFPAVTNNVPASKPSNAFFALGAFTTFLQSKLNGTGFGVPSSPAAPEIGVEGVLELGGASTNFTANDVAQYIHRTAIGYSFGIATLFNSTNTTECANCAMGTVYKSDYRPFVALVFVAVLIIGGCVMAMVVEYRTTGIWAGRSLSRVLLFADCGEWNTAENNAEVLKASSENVLRRRAAGTMFRVKSATKNHDSL
ncbi:hypothetical protein BJ742DRAFT_879558 [Cladochytrium replicatum]|nr:hypothetical protein BJ742DRAFT_879558 [Cladochytrium replicatum]